MLLVLAAVLAACADLGGQSFSQGGSKSSGTQPKRLVAAIMGDPPTLRNTVNATGGSGSAPGLDTVEEMLNVGLSALDNRGSLQPRLADAVPTIENGLWNVMPDGRMETVWGISLSARWHDGAPFTAQDLVFTATVGQDREVAIFRDDIYDAVESVEAIDPRTLKVLWRKAFIQADMLFTTGSPSVPLPSHLLERAYQEDKADFTLLPYWGPAFVGTGPFRLVEFARGSHLVLEANEHYSLGRPKIDEVEVRFIPDSNTLVANLLAESIELTLGRNLSLDQALQIRDDWKGGRLEAGPTNWIAIYPQLTSPTPAVVGNARFRRALLHAVDRQTMGESLQGGLGAVAHSIQIPEAPEYRAVENSSVRYEYDPRRAVQLIEELGYVAGPDGMFRDAGGARVGVELRNTGLDIEIKSTLAVADYWQRAGVGTEPLPIPPQRARDREYRATYPAFELVGNSNNLDSLGRIRLSQVPLPSNNYVGVNRSRYANPEFDALLERYFSTIALPERVQVLATIVNHMTEQVVWMGLFHRVDPAMIGSRLQHVGPRTQGATQAWNAHEWELR